MQVHALSRLIIMGCVLLAGKAFGAAEEKQGDGQENDGRAIVVEQFVSAVTGEQASLVEARVAAIAQEDGEKRQVSAAERAKGAYELTKNFWTPTFEKEFGDVWAVIKKMEPANVKSVDEAGTETVTRLHFASEEVAKELIGALLDLKKATGIQGAKQGLLWGAYLRESTEKEEIADRLYEAERLIHEREENETRMQARLLIDAASRRKANRRVKKHTRVRIETLESELASMTENLAALELRYADVAREREAVRAALTEEQRAQDREMRRLTDLCAQYEAEAQAAIDRQKAQEQRENDGQSEEGGWLEISA